MSFLTLGLTASAAAAHRHEFSAPATNTATALTTSPSYNIPLLSQGSAVATKTSSSSPSSEYSGKRVDIVSEKEGRDTSIQQQQQRPTISLLKRNSYLDSYLGCATNVENTIEEEELEPANVDVPDRPFSPTSTVARTLKVPKIKAAYSFAHSPHSSKRIGKGGLVLQLQKLTDVSRPIPAFDVLHASAVSSKSKRVFGKACQDLVLLASEDYSIGEEDEGSERSVDANERIAFASISQAAGKKGKDVLGRLTMRSGTQWTITQTSTGGYEFNGQCKTTGLTRTARWVPKSPGSRRASGSLENGLRSPVGSVKGERRFVFSILNPETRKHPIVASMTKSMLEVLEHNVEAIAVDGSRPPSPSAPSEFPSNASSATLGTYPETTKKMLPLTIDEIRTLIFATGAWVALQENFRESILDDFAAAYNTHSPVDARASSKLSRQNTHSGHASAAPTPVPRTSHSMPRNFRRWTGDFTTTITVEDLRLPVDAEAAESEASEDPTEVPTEAPTPPSEKPAAAATGFLKRFGSKKHRQSMPPAPCKTLAVDVDQKKKKKRAGFRSLFGLLSKKAAV